MTAVQCTTLIVMLGSMVTTPVAGQHGQPDRQIAAAVLPLPVELQSDAGVFTVRDGERVWLRQSDNGMVCNADDPADDQFDVRCYHRDFRTVMERAAALRAAGLSRAGQEAQLRREIDEGRLHLPSAPTAGYRMLGPIAAFDAMTATAGPEIRKWQSIHFPFKTASEMGLPENRETRMPFVMASGSWWSHVMIMHDENGSRSP